jgi:hypothetical protein
MAAGMAGGERTLVETVDFCDATFQVPAVTLSALERVGPVGCPVPRQPVSRVLAGGVEGGCMVIGFTAAGQGQEEEDESMANCFHR